MDNVETDQCLFSEVRKWGRGAGGGRDWRNDYYSSVRIGMKTFEHGNVKSSIDYREVNSKCLLSKLSFSQGTGSDYVFTQGTSGESDYYFASRVNPNNPNYMEVVLEGAADGWVAVGFSTDQIMVFKSH